MKCWLVYDLGTGGLKTAVYHEDFHLLASEFVEYPTQYPTQGYHEQFPEDWWNAIVSSTRKIMNENKALKEEIAYIAVSGHSLGVIPVDEHGALLEKNTPIWSDKRAKKQAADFFQTQDYLKWYLTTGGGFPAELYSLFKIKWFQEQEPELYRAAYKFIGSKDFINCRLCGKICTDYSYASGSGLYDLSKNTYCRDFIEKSGIDSSKLPEIYPSSQVLGVLSSKAAKELELPKSVKVVCGGVDNACMALGAGCLEDGDAYISLGSSAWVAVSSAAPILDIKVKPYVFAHGIQNKYISSTCIFSAGTTENWVKNNLCEDLKEQALKNSENPYKAMDRLAALSPAGSRGLVFNPTLAGGSGLDENPDMKGGIVGLTLGHNRCDILRSVLEGVAFNMKTAFLNMEKNRNISGSLLIVGGGAQSSLWMQIFADILQRVIITNTAAQNTAALGAAFLCAAAQKEEQPQKMAIASAGVQKKYIPKEENRQVYEEAYQQFEKARKLLSKF